MSSLGYWDNTINNSLSHYRSLFDDLFLFDPPREKPFKKVLKYRSETKEGKTILEIEIPGVKKEDIEVKVVSHVVDNKLKVKCDKKLIDESFVFPRGSDFEKVTARLEDGILFLEVPLKEKEERIVKVK